MITPLAPPATAVPALAVAGTVKGVVWGRMKDIKQPAPAVHPEDVPPMVASAFVVTLTKIRSVELLELKNSVSSEHVAAPFVSTGPVVADVDITLLVIAIWYRVGSWLMVEVPQT